MAQSHSVLWDLDGTLVDTFNIHQDAYLKVLKHENIFEFNYSKYGGWPTQKVFADIGISDDQIDQLTKKKQDLAYEMINPKVLMDDAQDVVRGLNELGWKQGIVTGASLRTAKQILDATKLSQYINLWVTAETQVEPKPSASPFLWAVEQLGLDIKRTVVVEDSIQTCNAIAKTDFEKIFCIRRSKDFNKLDQRVTKITSLYELLNWAKT